MPEDTESTETEIIDGPIAPAVEFIREKTQAKYVFTPEEMGELGRALQAARRDYRRIEEELDSIKAEYKAKLATAELEQDKFGRKLDDGFEMREAFAIVTFNDPARGRKTYRHEDTGAFIKEEPMSLSDQERPLFKDKDGRDATAPAESASAAPAPEGAEYLNTEGEGTKEDLGRILDDPKAGKTPLGEALDSVSVQTEQPKILIAAFHETDWKTPALMKAATAAAKKAGWPEAQVSTLRALLFPCDTVEAMKTILAPHVLDALSLESIIADAKRDYPDGNLMRAHFARVLSHFPSQYPGGNSEHNLNKFHADIAEFVEADAQKARIADPAPAE